jgi:transcriptional regulator with XRE-family HTH domain
MRNGTKKTTAALAGAVVLASAGYAFGSQAGNGSATAASGTSTTAEKPRPPRGEADLAQRLGVSEDKLRTALEAVRAAEKAKGGPGAEHTAALAKALGLSTEQVQQAMDKLRDTERDAFAAALAKELGVDAAKVKTALEKLRPERGPGGPREALGSIASELGVSEAKLRDALRTVRPGPGGRGRRGENREEREAALAKALGVSAEKLAAAQKQVRASRDDDRETQRKAFAAALAKELGIDAAKVEAELGSGALLGGPGHGRGGPGGPDCAGPPPHR